MGRVFGGGVLVIAGIAAFIEAHTHAPACGRETLRGECLNTKGLSQTAYDLLRIGGWGLVILGALLIVVGLIGYWGAQRERAPGGL